MKLLFRLSLAVAVSLGVLFPSPKPAHAESHDPKQYEQTVEKAIGFLTTKAQASDGSFNAAAGPAVTALVTTGLLRHGRSPNDPVVAKALKYLHGFVQKDGGIYGTMNKNYETAIAVMCFQEANRQGKYDDLLKKASAFLQGYQWGGDGKTGPQDVQYGGAGYGRTGDRPDLSNTSFLVDALRASGSDPNSPEMQRALVFVSRCQNLESQHNTTPFAAQVNDGGFYYTPAAGGSSQAGKDEATGGLRSYASMTYAGLKSMIYAGLKPDDPRVKAAAAWVQKHYDLDSNPGMGTSGLYYYYLTFAKALAALGDNKLVAADGSTHDWRAELIEALAKRQKSDGSWSNDNPRWMEGDASLSTGYALLALSYCRK